MSEIELKARIISILSGHTREMEGYSYFSSNPGIPEDEYEDIADEVMAALAPQWQPIESAPKDGTIIIGFSAAVGEPMLFRFIAPHEFLTAGEREMQLNVPDFGALKEVEEWLYREAWFYADFSVGDICESACQPSHWQPLPAPPEVEG